MNLTPHLGESIVMLQCCKIKSGYFVLRNYITKEKIAPLVKDTIMENYEFVDDDPATLKEALLADAAKIQQPKATNDQVIGTVPVDHSFNVKGVGAVILGLVTNGIIDKHTALNVLPRNKNNTATVYTKARRRI